MTDNWAHGALFRVTGGTMAATITEQTVHAPEIVKEENRGADRRGLRDHTRTDGTRERGTGDRVHADEA